MRQACSRCEKEEVNEGENFAYIQASKCRSPTIRAKLTKKFHFIQRERQLKLENSKIDVEASRGPASIR